MFTKYDHVFLQMAGAIILQLKSTFDCNYLLALTVQLNCLYGVVLKKTFFFLSVQRWTYPAYSLAGSIFKVLRCPNSRIDR